VTGKPLVGPGVEDGRLREPAGRQLPDPFAIEVAALTPAAQGAQPVGDDLVAKGSLTGKNTDHLIIPAVRSLFSVFLGMSPARLFGMIPGVTRVPTCCVSMMRRFLVVAAFMVLGRFSMMASGIRMML
jgi:hypothetical protein